MGKPARADLDRSAHPRHRAEHLYPQSEKVGGEPWAIEFETFPAVKDPLKEAAAN